MSVDLIDCAINNDKETNHLRLPDQSDSSENEESSPRKRPRSDHSNVGRTDNYTKENWDHYVRSGSKLKSLAGSILDVARHLQDTERIQTRQQNLGDVDNDNNHDECDNAPKFKTVAHPLSNTNDNAAKLAYEKTAECLMLEKVRFVSYYSRTHIINRDTPIIVCHAHTSGSWDTIQETQRSRGSP